jgi:hypothetical protein
MINRSDLDIPPDTGPTSKRDYALVQIELIRRTTLGLPPRTVELREAAADDHGDQERQRDHPHLDQESNHRSIRPAHTPDIPA